MALRDIKETDKAPFKATLTGSRGLENILNKKEYEILDVFYMWNYLYVEIKNDNGKPMQLRAHRFQVKTN